MDSPRALYWAFWSSGALVGLGVAILVLRRRDALDRRTCSALFVALAAFWVGAKWHFIVEGTTVMGALATSPAALLTPGTRAPLGFVLGMAAAAGWCALWRAPLRETADALAAGASAFVGVGRFGCFFNGCCTGAYCAHWPHSLCMRYPAGSIAYDEQVVSGIITNASVASLPAHPLPLYLALSALATLGLLVMLLRRNAAPATLFVAACSIAPATKLGFEMLRAGQPGGPRALTVWICVGTLAAAGLALAVLGRRGSGRPGDVLASQQRRPLSLDSHQRVGVTGGRTRDT